jgi:hypothetical protein
VPLALQPETLQSTGHKPASHIVLSVVAPHWLPPLLGCVVISRVLSVLPALQVAEQSPHADHTPMTQ